METTGGHQAPAEALEQQTVPERTGPGAAVPQAAPQAASAREDAPPPEAAPVAPPTIPPAELNETVLLNVMEDMLQEAAVPINATDVGNARRFIRMFTGRALHVASVGKWYLWDGNRWKPDEEETVLSLAAEVAGQIRAEAMTLRDPQDRADWNAWAHQTESVGHQTAIIKLAAASKSMSVKADIFDRDPMLLVVENGTLDLRTGQLRASRPEDLCSRQAAVTFDPEATCPKWRAHVKFVANVRDHDDEGGLELASYLRRAIGYSITGLTSERAFFFLTGDGSNGKNAFIEPIMLLLGDYGTTASSALLTGGDEQHPTIIADLMGRRLVFVDETRAGRRLNAERIKGLTGSKRVKARFTHQNFFEFEPQFKLWITGNGKPAVRDPSDGAWKRLNEVPCLGKVGVDVAPIDDYGDLLYREEASGILNWALEGLEDWKTTKLGKPKSVQAAIDAHRGEEDFVGQFIDECMLVTDDPEHYLIAPEVYEEYGRWADVQKLRGENYLNKIAFGQQLAEHLKRSPRPGRVGGRVTKVIHGVTWSDDVSLTAKVQIGRTV